VALSSIDRDLLRKCLDGEERSWEKFVDRFIGLVLHVIRHTARSKSLQLTPQDEEDLAAEFFVTILRDDYAILRRFRGESSLATYLTVISRRIVVRELLRHSKASSSSAVVAAWDEPLPDPTSAAAEQRISDREEVEQLMHRLTGYEADVVRLYHLEGKSYREISTATGVPENSVGPTLSRARAKMRYAVGDLSASK
jgi:RNA polymerase sigma-70 factor, ECF subfamily